MRTGSVKWRLGTEFFKTDLPKSIPRRSPMLSPKMYHPPRPRRQTTSGFFEMRSPQLPFFRLLFDPHAAILGHTDQEVVSVVLTRFPKREDIAPTIADIDPLLIGRDWADVLHTAFPHLRFSDPLFPLVPR